MLEKISESSEVLENPEKCSKKQKSLGMLERYQNSNKCLYL